MNSQPKMPAISQWLKEAEEILKAAHIPSPRLDAEIILAHTHPKTANVPSCSQRRAA